MLRAHSVFNLVVSGFCLRLMASWNDCKAALFASDIWFIGICANIVCLILCRYVKKWLNVSVFAVELGGTDACSQLMYELGFELALAFY